jgi:putative hydrolase of the HAD superfamily/pyrimidine and pyridine-specific 5'-nucleotidase
VLTAKIESYTTKRLGLRAGDAYALYKKYGTCLKGLMEEKYLDTQEHLDEFLHFAHDIPLEIERDEKLRAMLLKIKTPKWVFTASVKAHAQRCLEKLGIDDLFEGIIDVRAVGWETKHSPRAYEAAMRIAGVEDPQACLFLDDSVSNMRAAREVGWTNVLVGTHARDGGELITCEHADHIIATVHEFEALMPEHFDEIEDAATGKCEEDAVPGAPN